ncbi:TrkH family potassium uptake protein [Salsipaludibacter albus]|uniref:TrkH family potassium uptake protein n=1 Tax=Salsipaludibacter albus TaxID=2849650 RepID=UPI001EE4C3EA
MGGTERVGVLPVFLRGPITPAQFLALSFAGLIALGTALLWLPVSHASGDIGGLDAWFTATSAVCVTGLVVVDTGTAWSPFGQVVILLLFQLGGLGLLTFGTVLAVATGRRLGVGQRLRLQEQVRAFDLGSLGRLLRAITLIVVGAETAGAILLYVRMAPVEGPGRGAWYAVFHSVSAFNNAGFSLYPDSLVRYVDDPVVTLSTIALVVVGGLGFVVLVNLHGRFRGPGRVRLTLHTRMVLSMTAFLVVAAMAVLLVFEWNNPNTLGSLTVGDRLLASAFQAVTPRTAGFNTLDYAAMVPASLVVTILLMFIGGNPGSTAGGIKTVTFHVLVLGVWSVIRGRHETSVFGRRIDHRTVQRASAIVTGAVLLGGAAVTVLALVEPDIPFLALLFEAVSALGTVGLSLGVTDDLTGPGRVVIIALMYLGRIGFLTFALALVEQQRRRPHRFLAEEVVIG